MKFCDLSLILWEQVSYGPGAVCFSNTVLEHIWLRKFFQIINGTRPYGCAPYGPGPFYAVVSPESAIIFECKIFWCINDVIYTTQQNYYDRRCGTLLHSLLH